MTDSRPLSQAERRDIVSHTDHLLGRLRERSEKNLDGVAVYATKACVQLVYVGFGFKIMREQFADEESWKAFVRKWYPHEGHSAIDRYIAIGRHFHYDQSYLDFLSGAGYAVPPTEIDRKRNIGSQIDEMRKNGAKVGTPADLLKLAGSGYLPEIEDRKKALNNLGAEAEALQTNGREADHSIGSDPDRTGSDQESQQRQEGDKTPPVDDNAFVASRLTHRLLKSLTELETSKVYFEKLADAAPVSEWDKETVLQLKRALRPAKEMIDHLFEASWT